MTHYTIRAAEPDEETLLQPKEITVDGDSVETPVKALEVEKTRGDDQVNDDSRGVNELYVTVNRRKLEQYRNGGNSPLRERLEKASRRTNEGELDFVFCSFQETGQFDPANVTAMIDLMAEYGDFIVAPLMPEIAAGVESDVLDDEYFTTYQQNAEIFLDNVAQKEIGLPVVGVLPALARDQVDALIDRYLDANVDGFCYNLDRATITAIAKQEELVRPLVRKLGMWDVRKTTFTYVINGLSYGSDTVAGSTAEYLAAVSMGVDIVGGSHIGLQADEEVIEDFIASREGEPVTLRLLDPQTYAMTQVPVHKLDGFIPDETGLDVDRIKRRIKTARSEKSRYRKLINTEILAIVLDELVASIEEDGVKATLEEKTGIPDHVIERLTKTREAFDDGDSQSGLSDFTD